MRITINKKYDYIKKIISKEKIKEELEKFIINLSENEELLDNEIKEKKRELYKLEEIKKELKLKRQQKQEKYERIINKHKMFLIETKKILEKNPQYLIGRYNFFVNLHNEKITIDEFKEILNKI